VGEMTAQKLLAGVPGQARLGLVDIKEAALPIDLNDAHARVLVRGAKPALARPEIGLALAQEA